MTEHPEYLAQRSRLMQQFAFMALDCEAAIATAEQWNAHHRAADTTPRDFEPERVIRFLAWQIHDLAMNHRCIPLDVLHRLETARENRQLELRARQD